MLRAMKVLGIGLINAFALPTVIGKRAPFPTPGKTGGLHRAQPRPARKRNGQEDQARRRQKGPRSDLRHLLIQGAQAVLRMGRATALSNGARKGSRHVGVAAVARKLLVQLWHMFSGNPA